MQYRKLLNLVPPLLVLAVGSAVGAGLLGVVFPVGLFLFAAFVLGDMGGPLFWPILVIVGLVVGSAGGFLFAAVWLPAFYLVRRCLPASFADEPRSRTTPSPGREAGVRRW